MKTFKPAEAELPELKDAAVKLREANLQAGKAKKTADAAKAVISKYLKEKRDCDVATLQIGEIVNLDGVMMIKVTSQRRFDEKGFAMENAELHEKWVKPTPVRNYDPLV